MEDIGSIFIGFTENGIDNRDFYGVLENGITINILLFRKTSSEKNRLQQQLTITYISDSSTSFNFVLFIDRV